MKLIRIDSNLNQRIKLLCIFSRFQYFSLFASLIIASVIFVVPNASYAAESVKLQLRWLHQFQFAGYYMAKEKGFYAAENLDVELIEGGPQALAPIDDVLKEKVDFAVTGSGVVIERMQGKPVIALAAIMQTSPIVWITLKESHINTPHEMAGHDVLIMPAPESAELLTMLEKEGIDLANINIKPTTFDINDLIEGRAQAYDGYISNEPYFLEQRGIEYSIINPKDYGINFYSDVLITSEAMVDEKPEVVAAFKRASLLGWEYALNHIEESISLIHQQYAPEKSLDHLRFEAKTLKQLVMPELVQVGHMNPGRWRFIAQSYRNLDMTNADVDIDGFLFEQYSKPDYTLAIKIAFISLVLLGIAAGIIYKFRKMSVQLTQSNCLLKEQAITDQLTQVLNRRGLVEQARKVLNLAQRKQMPCSFLVLDIDHFKRINDQYGHHTGDIALKLFAHTIAESRREHDVIARVGGEEFAILLVDANIDEAKKLAEKMMQDIRKLVITCPENNETFSLSASMVITSANGTLERFWRDADKALYQAKNAGRNQIVVDNNTELEQVLAGSEA